MRRKTLYTTQEVDVDCEYLVDFDDLLELAGSCNKDQKEKIKSIMDNSYEGNHKRMKNLTLTTEQEVDVDCSYDVEFGDLIDMINDCDEEELDELMDVIDNSTSFRSNHLWINSDNLYDEQKLNLLKKSFAKYSLEELEQRLK